MRGLLEQGLAELGIAPPAGAVEKLMRYGQLLLEQNQVMNLTAITRPEEVATLHFLDSAALLGCAGLAGASLVDVGTGAGFPGVVLKVLAPDLRLTLVDSLGKRLDWLETVCQALGLEGVTLRHDRAEELAQEPDWREAFDFAAARAVADLRVLAQLSLPSVRVGGRVLAMNPEGCQAEVDAAGRAVSVLGGRLLPAWHYAIPGTEVKRTVAAVEKITPTPKGYPRRWARIRKAPL